jgi:hypothetical protein
MNKFSHGGNYSQSPAGRCMCIKSINCLSATASLNTMLLLLSSEAINWAAIKSAWPVQSSKPAP